MNMKLISAMVGAVCIACLSARAEICISFQTDGTANTIFDHTGVGNGLVPGGSLYLVIWSPDAVADFGPNPTASLNGDVVLDALSTDGLWAQDGAIVGNSYNRYGTGGAYATTGRVYIVLFEMPFASYSGLGSIASGTYYTNGPVTPGSLANSFGDGSALAYDYGALINSSPLATTLQTVPEPGTWALLSLGVMTIAAGRRRKKAA